MSQRRIDRYDRMANKHIGKADRHLDIAGKYLDKADQVVESGALDGEDSSRTRMSPKAYGVAVGVATSFATFLAYYSQAIICPVDIERRYESCLDKRRELSRVRTEIGYMEKALGTDSMEWDVIPIHGTERDLYELTRREQQLVDESRIHLSEKELRDELKDSSEGFKKFIGGTGVIAGLVMGFLGGLCAFEKRARDIEEEKKNKSSSE